MLQLNAKLKAIATLRIKPHLISGLDCSSNTYKLSKFKSLKVDNCLEIVYLK